jgi:hypothetical protein
VLGNPKMTGSPELIGNPAMTENPENDFDCGFAYLKYTFCLEMYGSYHKYGENAIKIDTNYTFGAKRCSFLTNFIFERQ